MIILWIFVFIHGRSNRSTSGGPPDSGLSRQSFPKKTKLKLPLERCLVEELVSFVIYEYRGSNAQGTTGYEELVHLNELPNVGAFGDAEHRGPRWYDHAASSDSGGSGSDMNSENTKSSSSSEESDSFSSSKSSDVSSLETNEIKIAKQAHRTCTPCPQDMLKKRNNIGIKWICGGYQRARRSFKSLCMMRYRNCEDGTLFVKLYDHRCNNDSYHGRHWFYVYRV